MKVILYARFSPRKDALECESVEKQLETLRAWAGKAGHEVVGEFSDKALSGSDHDRPAFYEALKSIRRGCWLVVTQWDRLARDTMIAVSADHKCNQLGATLYSVSEGRFSDHKDPQVKFMSTILSAFAEFDRHVKNARTKAGMLRNQYDKLIRQSDRPPYGFVRKGEKGLTPCLEEQRKILLILRWRRAGFSFRGVASFLRRWTGDRAWSPQKVIRIYRRASAIPHSVVLEDRRISRRPAPRD